MDWIAQNWLQLMLLVFAGLGVRELEAIRESAQKIESMMGSLRDVKGEIERGRARREEFGGGRVNPQSEKR